MGFPSPEELPRTFWCAGASQPLLGFSLEAAAKAGARLPHSKMCAAVLQGWGNPSLHYVKVHDSVGCMIFRTVDGLHHQAVGTRLQVIHFYLQTNGDHRISLLDEILGANDFGEEYLLVGRSLENTVAHAHNRRGRRGQQRLIDFRVQNYVVRMLEAIAA